MSSEEPQGDEPYWNSQIDQQIGSLLENWCLRDTGGFCRFCAVKFVGEGAPQDDKFCSEECEERFEQVFEARMALGRRDMDQRGYD